MRGLAVLLLSCLLQLCVLAQLDTSTAVSTTTVAATTAPATTVAISTTTNAATTTTPPAQTSTSSNSTTTAASSTSPASTTSAAASTTSTATSTSTSSATTTAPAVINTTAPANVTTTPAPVGGLPSNFCPLALVSAGSCTCDGGVCSVSVPYVVSSGLTLVVPANGQFVFRQSLTCETGSTIRVVVNSASAVPVPLRVAGVMGMGGTLSLRTGSATSSPSRAVPASVVIAQFGSSSGSFVVEAASTDGCTRVAADPVYRSTSLTVALATTQVCTPLTQGAIIAIAVFSAAGAVALLLVAAVVWLRCRRRDRRVADNEMSHY